MSNKKILVVDDEKDFLKVITYRLKKAGYEVITASNGKECIERAKRFSPDIIILDIMMPELDGLVVTLKLKSIDKTKDIPIIICTAVKAGEDKVVAQNLGVADYYKKSDEIGNLITKIRRVLQG